VLQFCEWGSVRQSMRCVQVQTSRVERLTLSRRGACRRHGLFPDLFLLSAVGSTGSH